MGRSEQSTWRYRERNGCDCYCRSDSTRWWLACSRSLVLLPSRLNGSTECPRSGRHSARAFSSGSCSDLRLRAKEWLPRSAMARLRCARIVEQTVSPLPFKRSDISEFARANWSSTPWTLFAGAIGVSESTGKCSPEYVVLEPVRGGLNCEYYAACLRWMAAEGYILVICPSVRERAPRLRFSTVKDIVFPVPPDSEQGRVAEEVQRARAATGCVDRLEDYLLECRRVLIEEAIAGRLGPPVTEAA